ncbi:LuxR C-terminal-related transcriptional regulator [Enterobacter asburiae]|uniref:LuxR C-terminal-related transcriptional regulator n=1 Tax=Scandinavium sp. UTDF21-P1B TaxID=3446379 RepID=UPI00346A00A9
MKIYILSDDTFFSLGVSEIFINAGYEALVLNPGDGPACLKVCGTASATAIIDINDGERLNRIFSEGVPHNIRLLFVTRHDSVEYAHFGYFNIFIPRRIACNRVVSWLLRYLREESRELYRLTEIESAILRALLAGEPPGLIATKMKLSVKTISRIKINALNKMGVCRMNCRSLLFVSDYLNKTVFLSMTQRHYQESYTGWNSHS